MEPVNDTRLEKCGYWLFKVGATVVYTGFEVLIDGLIDHVYGVRCLRTVAISGSVVHPRVNVSVEP
jgi:hypothetical protein